MWSLIRIAFSFVGVSSAGPIIGILLGLGTAALSVGGYFVHRWVEDYRTTLRNEGAMQCVGAVREAEHKQAKEDLKKAQDNLAAERQRADALEKVYATLRDESKSQHEAIKVETATVTATLPDRAVDAVNAPLTKASAKTPAKAPAYGGVK
jgi:hypothetical protein